MCVFCFDLCVSSTPKRIKPIFSTILFFIEKKLTEIFFYKTNAKLSHFQRYLCFTSIRSTEIKWNKSVRAQLALLFFFSPSNFIFIFTFSFTIDFSRRRRRSKRKKKLSTVFLLFLNTFSHVFSSVLFDVFYPFFIYINKIARSNTNNTQINK